MKRCPECDRRYPEGSYCGSCGSPLVEVETGGDPLLGTRFHGRYEVLERLGSGGFGTVYKVINQEAGRPEALKVVHPHLVTDENSLHRFRQEVHLMGNLGLRTPRIPTLFHVDREAERNLSYFTQEFIEGTTLKEILVREAPLPTERAIAIGRQICEALQVAHRADPPVIHRDLKPDNVMVSRRGERDEIKILDFGIAKIVGGETVTREGAIGSAGYIAPEYLEDKGVDGRTDLFAVGVILYNMVTGRDPWLGKRLDEPTSRGAEMRMVQRSLQEAPEPVHRYAADLPPEFEAIIARLLEKSPDARFPAAGDLDEALARVQPVLREPPRPAADDEAPARTRVVRRPARRRDRPPETTEPETGPGRDAAASGAATTGSGPRVADPADEATSTPTAPPERPLPERTRSLDAAARAEPRPEAPPAEPEPEPEPPPPTGGLRIASVPSGATVRLERGGRAVRRGRTPWEVEELPVGRYEVRVHAPRHEAATDSVTVEEGEVGRVRVTLERKVRPTEVAARAVGDAARSAAEGLADAGRRSRDRARAARRNVARGLGAAWRGAVESLAATARGVAGRASRGIAEAGRAIGTLAAVVRRGIAAPFVALGRAIGRVPRPSARAVAVAGLGAVAAGGGVWLALNWSTLRPPPPPDPDGGGTTLLSLDDFRRLLESDGVASATLHEAGVLRARPADPVEASVYEVRLAGGPLQQILSGLRRAGTELSAEGRTSVQVRPRPTGDGDGPADPAISVRSAQAACDPCPAGTEHALPAAWYSVRFGSEGWVVDSVLVGYGEADFPPERLAYEDSAAVFLPGGVAVDLQLFVSRPAPAGQLVEEIRGAIEAGRWVEALQGVSRARQAGVPAARVEPLAGRIRDHYRNEATGLLAAGSFAAARRAGSECLSHFPDDASCRGVVDSVDVAREDERGRVADLLGGSDLAAALDAARRCLDRFPGDPECERARDEVRTRYRLRAEEALGRGEHEEAGRLAGDCLARFAGDPECTRISDEAESALDAGPAIELGGGWVLTETLQSDGVRCDIFPNPPRVVTLRQDGAALAGASVDPVMEACGASRVLLEWRVESGRIDEDGRLRLTVRRVAENDGESAMAERCLYVSRPIEAGGAVIEGEAECGEFRGTWTLRKR